MDLQQEIRNLQATLKTQRDELQLKIHLGKMDAQEEWEKAEQQWQHFKSKADALGSAGKEGAQEIGAALKLLGEEIGQAFSRIRKVL